MEHPQEKKKALIVVRTYPVPAKKGVEVSCTGAITDKGEWLRLFPVPYRLLSHDQRFRKYQWVEVTVTKASDPRPESYKLKSDGIRILSDPLPTANGWQSRKDIILPLRAHCLCCLRKQRDEHSYPTLGLFRPKRIERLIMEPEDADWTPAQLAILSQQDLFQKKPEKELEKIPFSFRYEFQCEDDSCPGHKIICTDWEMGESWRKWKVQYGDAWEAKFRQRYETEMIQKYDTHFFVGTVRQHPGTWIIVGLFYPPKAPEDTNLTLFRSPA
jgi:hypothetical protein